MSELNGVFTGNMKRFRELRGFSQRELAIRIGVSMTFVSHIETGRKNPSLETVEHIGKALGVEPYELFLPNPREKRRVASYLIIKYESLFRNF